MTTFTPCFLKKLIFCFCVFGMCLQPAMLSATSLDEVKQRVELLKTDEIEIEKIVSQKSVTVLTGTTTSFKALDDLRTRLSDEDMGIPYVLDVKKINAAKKTFRFTMELRPARKKNK